MLLGVYSDKQINIKIRRSDKIKQGIDDNSLTNLARDGFAKEFGGALWCFVQEMPEFFQGNEFLIDIGGARGNNTKAASDQIPGKVVIIDPNVEPIWKIFTVRPSYIEKRFEDVDISQCQGKKVVVMALNYLQLYEYENKKARIEKMKQLAGSGGIIIIVDEVFREGPNAWIDWGLNKFYNLLVPGPYIRLCLDGYRYLFVKDCELEIKGEMNYNRGTYLWILRVK